MMKILNLRVVTRQQNTWNKGVQSNNKTGLKGVYKDNNCRGFKKFRARILVNGKYKMSSRVMTPEEAHAIYRKWEIQYFGEYARKI